MVCRPRNRSLGWRDTESFFYIYIYRREESGSMKGVRRVEGAASQYDKDVFQGSMSIGFPRSPCTTDIPHSFAGGISQYRRVQLIVTHFIYWNGKNVAFPPFLFFSSSCDLFSLALPYTILLPPFSLHFSLVSPRISSLSTSSCSNFFFLSSSRF